MDRFSLEKETFDFLRKEKHTIAEWDKLLEDDDPQYDIIREYIRETDKLIKFKDLIN